MKCCSEPSYVADYRAGKEKLFGFFVGLIMKASQGKANPGQVNEISRKSYKAERRSSFVSGIRISLRRCCKCALDCGRFAWLDTGAVSAHEHAVEAMFGIVGRLHSADAAAYRHVDDATFVHNEDARGWRRESFRRV